MNCLNMNKGVYIRIPNCNILCDDCVIQNVYISKISMHKNERIDREKMRKVIQEMF